MSKSSFAKFMKAFMVSAKAVPEDEIDKFVEDYTDDEHKIPSKEEIKFGPTEASSGEGVVRMIGDYSNPAPQQAITEEYIRFNRMIDNRLEAVGKAVEQQGKILAGVVAYMQKGISDVNEDDPDAEDEENAAMTAKAESSLKKARKFIMKAEMDDDDDDDETNEEKEEEVIRAEKALKVAAKALEKAEEEDEDEDRVEKALAVYKSLRKRVKLLRKSVPNKEDDRGNQGDEMNHESGNQEDGAAKSIEAQVKAALKELGITKAGDDKDDKEEKDDKDDVKKSLATLNLNLSQLFDVVAGRSQNGGAPVFQKSDAQAILKSKMQTVQDAIDNEELSELEIARAETLLSHMRAAQEGSLDSSVVAAEIAKASPNIQRLFAA